MRNGSPSHLGAAVRLAMAGIRRRGRKRPAVPVEPTRKLAVERAGIQISEGRIRRYLAATRGSNVWLDPSRVPPTYSAVWETALMLELLARDGMPFPSGGLVHLGGELVVVRPLRTDDRVRCRIEAERVEAHRKGTVLVLKCRSWNERGQLSQENVSRLLVQGAQPPLGAARSTSGRDSREVSAEAEGGEWRVIASWSIPADAGFTYARASGDFNPIHLWGWSSRLMGFARPILHGHCTLAMIAHELLRATGREPRRLLGSFRTPLELPNDVSLEVSGAPESGSTAFRLVAAGEADRTFVEGEWVGAEQGGQLQ